MNNAPIRRYSDKAPPPLTGIEFLRPYSVRNNAVFLPFTENTWHVVNSSRNNERIATFDNEEKALHHARQLNFLHLPRLTSEEEINRQSDEERLGSKIIIVIFVASLLIWKLVQFSSLWEIPRRSIWRNTEQTIKPRSWPKLLNARIICLLCADSFWAKILPCSFNFWY